MNPGLARSPSIPALGLLLLLLLLLLTGATTARADGEPREWLERMARSLDGLNYEGTLLHLNGGDPMVLKVVHRIENGIPTERITAMDDVGREIIRRGDEVTCILPDQRSVLVESGPAAAGEVSPLRRPFAAGASFDQAYYRLAIASGGRLVGRETRLVTVRPTDSYRYGYQLWLDEATALPLKVQVTGEDGGVVEQLMFSDINLPARIPAERTRPSRDLAAFTWHRTPAADKAGGRKDAAGPWHARSLPPGFALRAVRAEPMNSGEPPTRQLVYSDGVASVSVFVAQGVAPPEQAAGASRMGAANAYTTLADGHLVTAVGEVPVRTVETIARSVQKATGVAATGPGARR